MSRFTIDFVIGFILDKIICEQIKVGEILPNERSLSELIGSSRATIREALNILSWEDIILIQHGKPTKVLAKPTDLQISKFIRKCDYQYNFKIFW